MTDLTDLVAVFFVFGGGFWVLRPIVQAVSKRISAGKAPAADPAVIDQLQDEIRHVREEVSELAERVDFTERALAQQRDKQRIAPPA